MLTWLTMFLFFCSCQEDMLILEMLDHTEKYRAFLSPGEKHLSFFAYFLPGFLKLVHIFSTDLFTFSILCTLVLPSIYRHCSTWFKTVLAITNEIVFHCMDIQ